MSDLPTITTFRWVPPPARGYVRDLRARWALEEEERPYALRLLDMGEAKGKAYRREQPFGQVPAFVDGDVAIFESGAISLHVAERGSRLLPSEPAARARAIQWVFAALTSIEPWIMQLLFVDVFEAGEPWSPMRRAKVVGDMRVRLDELAAALGDRDWLDGDRFTVGDLMMVSVLGQLRHGDMLAGFPAIAAYVARGEARPAHRKAMADQLALYADPA